MTDNVFLEFLEKYADNSRLFVREVLGADPDDWQDKVLAAYDRRERRISIRSGHGVGKTTVLAWLLVHHAVCRFPQKAVCTAPTQGQLFDALASETKTWFRRLPAQLQQLFDIKLESIVYLPAPTESFISFRTSSPDKPEALAGVHSDWVLLIADEASGIPEAIFEAASGSMSGHNAITLLAGNPVRTSGLFFDTHHELKSDWTTFHVSSLTSPRVNDDYVTDMKKRYGDESNAFRVRVLGEFPKTDDDAVISFEATEAALERDVQPKRVRPIWGVDIARKGRDATVLAKRQGNVLLEPTMLWRDADLMSTAGRIKHEWEITPPSMRPSAINIDAIGLGAGVADRLREQGLPAFSINVSESASISPWMYANLRSELWFRGKEWFDAKDVVLHGVLPDGTKWKDEDLAKELRLPTYDFRSNGKIMVEGKKDTIRRTKKPSPNRADAFLLTFASPAISLSGGVESTTWNQPLRREIKGIV